MWVNYVAILNVCMGLAGATHGIEISKVLMEMATFNGSDEAYIQYAMSKADNFDKYLNPFSDGSEFNGCLFQNRLRFHRPRGGHIRSVLVSYPDNPIILLVLKASGSKEQN